MDIDSTSLKTALTLYAPGVVFANVLLQQLGLPLPVLPTLLLAGSLAASLPRLAALLTLAVCAAILADRAWYLVGRRFGTRVLAWMCKLSINPGSCISQTADRFGRWGAWSLLLAKFIPGFSAVAAPLAGVLHMPVHRFTLAAASGAALRLPARRHSCPRSPAFAASGLCPCLPFAGRLRCLEDVAACRNDAITGPLTDRLKNAGATPHSTTPQRPEPAGR